MPYKIVRGDLLKATTEYIVQQNCCTGIRVHGLSEAIAKEWPDINPYKDRHKLKGNWAIEADRPSPGSIFVYEFDQPLITGLRGVICAFAQYNHGKSGKFNDPLGLDKKDSPIDRIQYFIDCLDGITSLSPKSIGIPWKIGCGLGGGSWLKYEQIIKKWAEDNPSIDVVLYRLDD